MADRLPPRRYGQICLPVIRMFVRFTFASRIFRTIASSPVRAEKQRIDEYCSA
jgi:hypothetical protein